MRRKEGAEYYRDMPDGHLENSRAKVKRFVWRSKPTRSPLGPQVRAIVVQDRKGKYWAGTRSGLHGAKKAKHAFWGAQYGQLEMAMEASRQFTRDRLMTDAQIYAESVTGPLKPGEAIVNLQMDDGWSIKISAPGRIHLAESLAMKILDGVGKRKTEEQAKLPTPRRSRLIDR